MTIKQSPLNMFSATTDVVVTCKSEVRSESVVMEEEATSSSRKDPTKDTSFQDKDMRDISKGI